MCVDGLKLVIYVKFYLSDIQLNIFSWDHSEKLYIKKNFEAESATSPVRAASNFVRCCLKKERGCWRLSSVWRLSTEQVSVWRRRRKRKEKRRKVDGLRLGMWLAGGGGPGFSPQCHKNWCKLFISLLFQGLLNIWLVYSICGFVWASVGFKTTLFLWSSKFLFCVFTSL